MIIGSSTVSNAVIAACQWSTPEIGAPASEDASQPEVDLRSAKRGGRRACVRKSGEPYE